MSKVLLCAAAACAWLLGAAAASAQAADAAPATLGALAPANLKKPRPKPPFDLTGTWFVDTAKASFRFGPPYPKFKPEAQAEFDAGTKATAEHRAYKDYIGQCYPAVQVDGAEGVLEA